VEALSQHHVMTRSILLLHDQNVEITKQTLFRTDCLPA